MTHTAYRTDFYAWTKQQAALLEAEEWEKLDIPNIKEEIESMGRSQRKEVKSRLLILLLHLLKWQYQPHKNKGNSWRSTIRTQRNEIEIELSDSPSLRREVPDFVEYVYLRARKGAAEETGLALSTFPVDCPWTVAEIVDEDWLPV